MSINKNGMVKLMSFGFKYGIPNANFYFDVSFAKNPARNDKWGLFGVIDHEMVDFVLKQEPVSKFIELMVPLIEHIASVDSFQTVALGCNSGRHRSPIIIDEIAARLVKRVNVSVEHRNLPEYETFIYSIARGGDSSK